MQRWLFLALVLISQTAFAQKGFLYVKKKSHRVKSYAEGEHISFRLKDETIVAGYITLVKKDSVYVNGNPYCGADIISVLLPRKKKEGPSVSGVQLGLITAGVVLASLGMVASKWETYPRALYYSAAIGYGPLAIQWLFSKVSFKRNAYPIGKKFSIQLFDLHFTTRPAF
jgi:hypothetical protein